MTTWLLRRPSAALACPATGPLSRPAARRPSSAEPAWVRRHAVLGEPWHAPHHASVNAASMRNSDRQSTGCRRRAARRARAAKPDLFSADRTTCAARAARRRGGYRGINLASLEMHSRTGAANCLARRRSTSARRRPSAGYRTAASRGGGFRRSSHLRAHRAGAATAGCGDLPVARVDADRRRDGVGRRRALAVALDLFGEDGRQVGVERDRVLVPSPRHHVVRFRTSRLSSAI